MVSHAALQESCNTHSRKTLCFSALCLNWAISCLITYSMTTKGVLNFALQNTNKLELVNNHKTIYA